MLWKNIKQGERACFLPSHSVAKDRHNSCKNVASEEQNNKETG